MENTSSLNFPQQQNIHQISYPSYTSNAIATSSKFINDSSSNNHAPATITTPLMTKLEQTLLTNKSNVSSSTSFSSKY